MSRLFILGRLYKW